MIDLEMLAHCFFSLFFGASRVFNSDVVAKFNGVDPIYPSSTSTSSSLDSILTTSMRELVVVADLMLPHASQDKFTDAFRSVQRLQFQSEAKLGGGQSCELGEVNLTFGIFFFVLEMLHSGWFSRDNKQAGEETACACLPACNSTEFRLRFALVFSLSHGAEVVSKFSCLELKGLFVAPGSTAAIVTSADSEKLAMFANSLLDKTKLLLVEVVQE